jgi:hypothetical protein
MKVGRIEVKQNSLVDPDTEGNIILTVGETKIDLTLNEALAISAFVQIFNPEIFNGDTYNERNK